MQYGAASSFTPVCLWAVTCFEETIEVNETRIAGILKKANHVGKSNNLFRI